MGVTGLWRLIEPAGKPVPVETLENKVLAVDISIWLHQMVKGYQDAKGAPLPNAHLIGLFQRLCKLLYFRIKPVFVFDGAFPDLKKETIAKRQDNKSKYNSESERLKRELALLLGKKTAVNSLLGKQTSPKKAGIVSGSSNNDDIFKLPALPEREEEYESESDDEQNSSGSVDLHTVDIESKDFKTMPVKEKYDLLLELKETRKMNSWGRLHELPKKSDNFSDFQMQRLLKRRKVQECLEETEKEMGDTGMSLNELESLLNEEGIETKVETLPTRRIASNNTTRFLLINNVKQALKDARKKKLKEIKQEPEIQESEPTKHELEDDLEKAIKMSLDCVEEQSEEKYQDYAHNLPGTSNTEATKLLKDELEEDFQKAIKMSLECTENEKKDSVKTDDSWTSFLTDSDYSTDSDQNDGFIPPDMSSAKAYIMQYSDYTPAAIEQIVDQKNVKNRRKTKVFGAEQIIQELNSEKSIIIDNIDLSSDENASPEKNIFKKDHIHETNEIKELPSPTHFPNSTQASVIFIENSVEDIIELDISSKENENFPSKPNVTSVIESESSDEDFEEVTDESSPKKPVVELTLNMDNVPDEDDIFADVFKLNKDDSIKTEAALPSKSIKSTDNCNEEHTIHVQPNKVNLNLDQTKEINETQPNSKNEISSLMYSKSLLASDTACKVKEIPAGMENVKLQPIEVSSLDDKNTTAVEYEKITEKPRETLNEEKLNSIVDEIQNAEKDILQEKGRLDRIGRNITEQMTKDAQELLQIFGIPYVVAPMEAEAQCAFLENIKLTDGTITDDSDIWLFGGRTVYKNFFNQKKHVSQFLAERIENSFNLTREQLILLALLVGSDYTTGVTGIGPVTALEILSSFPFNRRQLLTESSGHIRYAQIIAGLTEFKQWVRGGKRTDNITLKKKLRNVELVDEFPSIRVVQAYMEPNVEKSNEKFTWGELDITVLRDYTKAKFGWSQNKLDEIIKPVLKRIIERKSQKSVKDYFKRKIEFQSLEDQMSKRVKAAVQRMGPESVLETQSSNENKTDLKKATKKTVRKLQNDSNSNEEIQSKSKPVSNKAKRKKKDEEIVLSNQVVRVVSENDDGSPGIEIHIKKNDRFQEIIPQREKNKQSLLENKMKAIELFRKTKIDRKKKPTKRRALVPKDKAELSESSDSN